MSPKGPTSLSDILQQIGCQKIVKARRYETLSKISFQSDIRFSQYIFTESFFNTIGIFDVIL